MISTVYFSWRRHNEFNLWNGALLAAAAVRHAQEHFEHRILVTNDAGRAMLCDRLQLPFTDVLPLPPGPKDCDHVYGITKLQAHAIACARGKPYVHHDLDGRLEKGLPPGLHDAPIIAEGRYTPPTNEFHALNLSLPAMRLPQITTGLASGIFGGNDLDGIARWAETSLRCAFEPRNLPVLQRENGYRASAVLEECAADHDLGDKAHLIYTKGDQEDAERTGWFHLAGLKRDRGALVQSALMLQQAFPDTYADIFRRWKQPALVNNLNP